MNFQFFRDLPSEIKHNAFTFIASDLFGTFLQLQLRDAENAFSRLDEKDEHFIAKFAACRENHNQIHNWIQFAKDARADMEQLLNPQS